MTFSVLLMFFTSWTVSAYAQTPCLSQKVQSILQPAGKSLETQLVAKAIRKHREQIIAGYHLPRSYTESYYARRIEPYLAHPNYAAVAQPQTVYRGMYVTVDELADLIEHGHDIDKVQWKAGGGGLSFSSSIEEAKTYIFHSADGRPGGVGVIFEVRYSEDMKLLADPELNSTRTIFKTQQSVPPGQTVDVMLWGQWGAEKLESVLNKADSNGIVPHERWTHAFENFR